ncbi:hypothetical protein AALB39_04635 [Lachnospiraceae bacterium 54-53]
MQSYLRQYDWSIVSGGIPGVKGGGILLGSKFGSGDSMYRYCTIVVNNISVDLTPFRTIRYTYNGQFSSGSDGIGCRGDFIALSTAKRQIKRMGDVFWGGYSSETTTDIDISDINQHAFFYADFGSASKVGTSGDQFVIIQRIEFLT